jgi:hypothetical protein
MTTVKKPSSGGAAADNTINAGSAGLMSRLEKLTTTFKMTFSISKDRGASGSMVVAGIGSAAVEVLTG